MNILQIASDFSNTKVHSNLFRELDNLGVNQVIFNPIRIIRRDTIGNNEFSARNAQFVYADVVKPYHHLMYHVKSRCLYKALLERVDVSDINLTHAATLMTDGGVAYKLYKKYHIPYVVAVRNTDINGFLDLLPNTWLAGKKILRNAKMIFFISKALMDKFSNHRIIKPILPEIKNKMILIPNGIDDYYIDHVNHKTNNGQKVLYVGDFSKNKNVLRLCEALFELRKEKEHNDVTLTLVGGGCDDNNDISRLIDSYPEAITYLGPIYDKEKLCAVFKAHTVFAMPSIHETFGLVYLEALSQNIPIVYTKGQGVDGLFDDSVGIGVNPLSVNEIKEAIKTILLNRDNYFNKTVEFEKFRWSNIAANYVSMYKEVLNSKSIIP